MADLLPCEICNEYIPVNEYNDHAVRCLRLSRIAGFLLRQQYLANLPEGQEEDDEDDEAESEEHHSRDIASISRYFTQNAQISRASLNSFLNDHFHGAGSPPTRPVLWFTITTTRSQAGSSSSSQSVPRSLGLTEEQMNEVSYSSLDKEELVIEKEDICPICQENLGEVIDKEQKVCILACSHLFCDSCIKKWLNKHKKCPMCMVDLEDAYCWGR